MKKITTEAMLKKKEELGTFVAVARHFGIGEHVVRRRLKKANALPDKKTPPPATQEEVKTEVYKYLNMIMQKSATAVNDLEAVRDDAKTGMVDRSTFGGYSCRIKANIGIINASSLALKVLENGLK